MTSDSFPGFPFKQPWNIQQTSQVHSFETFVSKVQEKKRIDNISLPCTHMGRNLFSHPQLDFPGGAVVNNPSANARDTGSSPGLGRSHMPRSN